MENTTNPTTSTTSGVVDRGLKKVMSGPYLWALASATILGPWIVMTQFWFSVTGPSLSLAFAVTMMLMIPVAFCYSEMVSMLPYAGGSYNYIGHAFGPGVAFIFMWSTAISYFAVIAFNIMCVVQILQYAGIIPMTTEVLIGGSMAFAIFYALLNWYKLELSATVQYVLFWLLFITGMIWNGLDLFISPQFSLANFSPYFAFGMDGFLLATGIMVTMYFGFEVVANMVEESKYPSKKMAWPVVGSVLTAGAVYLVTLTAMAGVFPLDTILSDAALNYPAAVIFLIHGQTLWAQVGWVGIVLGGLAAALTCVDGFWLALSRLWFALGEANLFPKFLSRLNKFSVPGIASLCVLIGVGPAILIMGTDWIQTLFVLMGIAISIVYFGAMLAYIRLRMKYPDWKRPYKAPGGIIMGILGLIGSGFCVYWSAFGMTPTGWTLFLSYIAIGVFAYIYLYFTRKSKIVLMPPVQ
ncbi:MAG: APC family permease [Candidatus Methanomethylicus sp.]|nr:APC family permease [Candidatus Methanomethylicus sp.]